MKPKNLNKNIKSDIRYFENLEGKNPSNNNINNIKPFIKNMVIKYFNIRLIPPRWIQRDNFNNDSNLISGKNEVNDIIIEKGIKR